MSPTPACCSQILDIYFINAQKSAEVDLNEDAKKTSVKQIPTLGSERIEKSDSEMHLGVDMNCADTADIKTRMQMVRRTMYAMMGAAAYGCSGVTHPTPGRFSSLEGICSTENAVWLGGFCLSNKDVFYLEQLQRAFMKRIQCPPINTATSAAYGY